MSLIGHQAQAEHRCTPARPHELLYAATSRCRCGAGLAYWRDDPRGPHGAWECSSILLAAGSGEHVGHDGPFPFMFYEIKSDDQPSACGATTRPSMPSKTKPTQP